MKKFEIIVSERETKEMQKIVVDGEHSFYDIQKTLSINQDLEVIPTLELYLHNKFLQAFHMEILHERKIYDLPLKKLIGQHRLYDIIKVDYLIGRKYDY